MSTKNYKTALDAAIREYEALGEQRRDIDVRLSQLAQTIGMLTRLLGYVPTVPLGLTDAVRLVSRAGVPMTPVEVREKLHGMGFDLSGYASELSAIHTVLKRLNGAGELRIVPRPNKKDAYLWQRPTTSIAIGPDVAEYLRQSGPAAPPRRTRKGRKKS
jgi:hypothetical protein